MSDLLGIGASGLRAYSAALATIGDNIANAQSPGFARRALRLHEPMAAGDTALIRANVRPGGVEIGGIDRSEEHTSELQSLMRISNAVFCLKNKNKITTSS